MARRKRKQDWARRKAGTLCRLAYWSASRGSGVVRAGGVLGSGLPSLGRGSVSAPSPTCIASLRDGNLSGGEILKAIILDLFGPSSRNILNHLNTMANCG